MNLTQKAKYNEIAAAVFTLYIVIGVIMKLTGTGTLDDNLAIALAILAGSMMISVSLLYSSGKLGTP